MTWCGDILMFVKVGVTLDLMDGTVTTGSAVTMVRLAIRNSTMFSIVIRNKSVCCLKNEPRKILHRGKSP